MILGMQTAESLNVPRAPLVLKLFTEKELTGTLQEGTPLQELNQRQNLVGWTLEFEVLRSSAQIQSLQQSGHIGSMVLAAWSMVVLKQETSDV